MTDKNYEKARRKELKEAVSKWRSIRKVTEAVRQECMEDGKGIIHVQADELYNPLSAGKIGHMNEGIFDYIEQCAGLLPAMVPLVVILHGVDEADRENVPFMYKQHYELAMQEQFRDKHLNGLKTLYMAIIGSLLIVIYLVLALVREGTLFLEILSIVGSFALCEAAGGFMVQRHQINRELIVTAQYLTAEIRFEE